ncbi:MAG: M14 family zinc carboxypeptidase [Nitriliruptorales bacterium]|nr:M14 family zinc carboxypeptidase [Nitriliruptorales bacterium]
MPISVRSVPFLVLTLLAGLTVLAPQYAGAEDACGVPGEMSAEEYTAQARVFPDPHAYWPSPENAAERSPWAKGNGACQATDFLGWDEVLNGLTFLASDDMFGEFIEIYDLSDEDGPFWDTLEAEGLDGMSAGLPTGDLGRERVPLYLIRVTDETDTTIPISERAHFAHSLSIHGIERAGVEGGIRAIEDLATWASCEKHGDDGSPAFCDLENAGPDNPHPILETMPDDSVTAGQALKETVNWFVLANPDGWRRGDKQEGGFFYQRYNGNGVDMNRDWPTRGFTFRPYTPWSEPETRSYGEVLKAIKSDWTGGLDLHGQLIDRAFSFTLIGGSERPYDKDRRILQYVKGAWEDAEARLAWSPLIKPNDAPEEDPRVYGVQWGTVWDTIAYTVTGALGDWMDSDMGLNADAIDNEMSLSHLGNCGTGTCYDQGVEQAHVDGNKSLIYGMIHFSLLPEDTGFRYGGEAGYLFNPDRITHPGSGITGDPNPDNLPQQDDLSFVINHTPSETTHEFDVEGPDQGVYNGSMSATVTWNNVSGVSLGSLNEIALERKRSGEDDPDRGTEDDDEWAAVNTYFNQSFVYAQSGARLDANLPEPGRYRIRIAGDASSQFDVDVTFGEAPAWPDPGQLPYDVSNMDFFEMLEGFAAEELQAQGEVQAVSHGEKLAPLVIDGVIAGDVDLQQFDTIVAADNAFLPDFVFPASATAAREPVEDETVVVGGPGAGERTPATSGFYEFEITEAQGSLSAEVTSEAVVDPDLYLQIQGGDGGWYDIAAGESGRTQFETLTYPDALLPGNYRLEVHNWAGSAGTANVNITFEGRAAQQNPSEYGTDDLDALTAELRSFVESGGNLVLTDDSLRALEWLGIVPEDHVRKWVVYAGHVQFSTDGGETTTYDDPLAANVNQPGAAEGSGHRHQIAEPVPTGYAIQDESGGDMNTHPQWVVERNAFEDAGGRTVGVVNGDTTLGEVGVGDGVIRVLGSVLPTPTEEFDHPYGLESYGVTYSGYEVMRNLLDYEFGSGPAAGDDGTSGAPADEESTPETGGGALPFVIGLLLLAGAFAVRRRSGVRSAAWPPSPRRD